MAEQTKTNEQELNILTIVQDVLRGWWIILLTVLIAAMGAYVVVTEMHTPRYTASSTLVVSYVDADATVYSNQNAANTLANVFSQVLGSKVMKQKVCEALGVDDFNGEISAVQVEETNLLTVTVTADTPRTAYLAAKALIENYRVVTGSIMGNVTVAVLRDPTMPMGVSNPMNRAHYVKLAALVGGLLAAALLGALSFMRDTVKSERNFSRKVDARLLATVYNERKYKTLKALIQHKKTSILVSNPTTGFGFVETYKMLRTKVENAADKKAFQVLMVTSVLENEGKSTVAANLALSLAQKGYRVVLVDGDLRRPAVYKLFDRRPKNKTQMEDMMRGTLPVSQCSFLAADYGLQLLGGSRPCMDSTDLVGSDGMKMLLNRLRDVADFVVVDTPPMALVPDGEYIARITDASLLVVRQNMALARDINDAADTLRESGSQFLGCVLNNVQTTGLAGQMIEGGSRYGYGYGYGYGRNYGYGERESSRRRGHRSSADADKPSTDEKAR